VGECDGVGAAGDSSLAGGVFELVLGGCRTELAFEVALWPGAAVCWVGKLVLKSSNRLKLVVNPVRIFFGNCCLPELLVPP
jgi:hypothetical protein